MKDEKILKIYCGGYHSVIFKNKGEICIFGFNEFGQLGIGKNQNQNKPVL